MEIDKEALYDAGVPQLLVFWTEGAHEPNDTRPLDSIHQSRREWVERETYWAGSNRAGRFSARPVA